MAGRLVQGAPEALENRLANVVVIVPRQLPNMEGDSGMGREGSKKFADALGREFANLVATPIDIENKDASAAHVEGHEHERLVHGSRRRPVPLDGLVTEGLGEGLAEDDANVLDRMVVVDVEVAFAGDTDIDLPMEGKLLEHVVEKPNAGGDVPPRPAVESSTTWIRVSEVSR